MREHFQQTQKKDSIEYDVFIVGHHHDVAKVHHKLHGVSWSSVQLEIWRSESLGFWGHLALRREQRLVHSMGCLFVIKGFIGILALLEFLQRSWTISFTSWEVFPLSITMRELSTKCCAPDLADATLD